MTDPSDALRSFQGQLKQLQLHQCDLDKELFVHIDHPDGNPRFTYVRLKDQTVTTLVNFIPVDPIKGIPCFQIGYAVPEAYRKQGRAKDTVIAAIAEMKNGLERNKLKTFYLEAIVGKENEASKKVADATFLSSPTEVTDSVSGLEALQYVRKIG